MVRGKFTLSSITRVAWSPTATKLAFNAEYDSSIPEDVAYAKATPVGSIEMLVDNPAALAQLELGKKYYVDFSPVDPPAAG